MKTASLLFAITLLIGTSSWKDRDLSRLYKIECFIQVPPDSTLLEIQSKEGQSNLSPDTAFHSRSLDYRAQTDHYREEMENQRLKQACASLGVIIALAFLLFTLCFLRLRSRKIATEMELQRAKNKIEKKTQMLRLANRALLQAKKDIGHKDEQLAEIRCQIAKLFQRQFAEIGQIFDYCRTEEEMSRIAAELCVKRVEEIINEINSSGNEEQSEFEKRINRDLDNIMEKLRKDFPEFKKSDFRFLSYIIVGFDATTRAIILNETQNNMRVKKSRLLKIIMNSKSENLPLYSSFLMTDKKSLHKTKES